MSHKTKHVYKLVHFPFNVGGWGIGVVLNMEAMGAEVI